MRTQMFSGVLGRQKARGRQQFCIASNVALRIEMCRNIHSLWWRNENNHMNKMLQVRVRVRFLIATIPFGCGTSPKWLKWNKVELMDNCFEKNLVICVGSSLSVEPLKPDDLNTNSGRNAKNECECEIAWFHLTMFTNITIRISIAGIPSSYAVYLFTGFIVKSTAAVSSADTDMTS